MISMVLWGGLRFLPPILHDRYILSSLLSMVCAQGMKPFTGNGEDYRISWRRITQAGGMPSSHVAVAAALTASLGLDFGWTSPLFQISAVLGGIVVYDAITLRRVVGEHTRVLKERLHETATRSFLWSENVGHTPLEASVGLLLGILCAILVVRV
jgi:hypothetical protein